MSTTELRQKQQLASSSKRGREQVLILHNPKGVPAVAYTGVEKLEHIKSSPFPIDKTVDGLNVTFTDRGVVNINEEDLQNAITLAGESLYRIISKSKI